MLDLSSLTRDQTRTFRIGRQSLNHCTARDVPIKYILKKKKKDKHCCLWQLRLAKCYLIKHSSLRLEMVIVF